jgi:hypothetical protein
MQSIEDMITILTGHPDVLGLMEYGRARVGDERILGDYDLFAVLKRKDRKVESLHFYVGGVPVDPNLRTLDEIRDLDRATDFDNVLLEMRIIYDPAGDVEQEIRALRQRHEEAPPNKTSSETVAFIRHGARHSFDSIRGRLDSNPTLCSYLLHQNVYWLVRHYFLVRNLEFKGDKFALDYIRRHEPQMYELIERFYTASDHTTQMELSYSIAEGVHAPVVECGTRMRC